MMYLWLKALHILFMVTWFCGIFYLPRLFVYHALASDKISQDRFVIMERKLFFGIMTPGAILTLIFGGWLIMMNPIFLQQPWMHIKLTFVLLTVLYHFYLGKLYFGFKAQANKHGHVFYRWLNEVPVLFLTVIVIMVVVKPFS